MEVIHKTSIAQFWHLGNSCFEKAESCYLLFLIAKTHIAPAKSNAPETIIMLLW